MIQQGATPLLPVGNEGQGSLDRVLIQYNATMKRREFLIEATG